MQYQKRKKLSWQFFFKYVDVVNLTNVVQVMEKNGINVVKGGINVVKGGINVVKGGINVVKSGINVHS